jgi:hypothetical protein
MEFLLRQLEQILIGPILSRTEAQILAEVNQILERGGVDLSVAVENNGRGRTLLHRVFQQFRPHITLPIVVRLLDAGADPNVRDTAGHTPYWYALRTATPDILHLLRTRGARLDELDNTSAVGIPRTPVQNAVINRDLETLRILLDSPLVDIRSPTIPNKQLAFLAADHFQPDIFRLLVDKGLQLNLLVNALSIDAQRPLAQRRFSQVAYDFIMGLPYVRRRHAALVWASMRGGRTQKHRSSKKRRASRRHK